MSPDIFFQGWSGLVRTLIVGVLGYSALILVLRATGKRTLSKMNAFDMIVTVALGSTLATLLLSEDVALAEGLTALAFLCLLQYAVTFLSVRSPGFQSLIKAQPTLLYFRGRYLTEGLRRERVTREEILAAIRSEGHGGLGSVEAVVLETDGTLSVVGSNGTGEALAATGNWERFDHGEG